MIIPERDTQSQQMLQLQRNAARKYTVNFLQPKAQRPRCTQNLHLGRSS